MGRIGRAVAKRAKGFDMEIHYHNRSRLPENLEKGAIFHEQLKDLLSQSEFLSINCPGGKDNTNLLNKETLKYLPDGAVVANAARGEIINDKDMLDAIRIGKVFALGLDVYKGEPKINKKYLDLDNLFPICSLCNKSMGTTSIDDWSKLRKKKHKWYTGLCFGKPS